MRKMILAPVLSLMLASALVLSAPASAGDMQFGSIVPTPTPTPMTQAQGITGEPNVDSAISPEEVDNLTKSLLKLIESVLALV